ncbi:universal stress protein [Streptomyces sp. 6N223]|uniref:universal stress protein n=1 Tax=Streptomyces sp. 6N223 TaxID=3457412 RepID=UPI003FD45430
MTRPVVAGVDRSAEAAAAAEWAAAEAVRRTAPLRLVSAVPEDTGGAGDAGEAGELSRSAERLLTRTRDDLLDRHRELAVQGVVAFGAPAAALLDASGQAELIVLGSRGLGTLAGFLLGSVSAPVVARAACPVVVVRTREFAEGGEEEREVVVGLKRLREPDAEVLDFAFGAARRQRLALRVVHAWRGGPPPPTLADALRPWRSRHPDVRVGLTLLQGNAAKALLDASGRAALVVAGRGTRAVVHALLHHCAAPVAVVPRP